MSITAGSSGMNVATYGLPKRYVTSGRVRPSAARSGEQPLQRRREIHASARRCRAHEDRGDHRVVARRHRAHQLDLGRCVRSDSSIDVTFGQRLRSSAMNVRLGAAMRQLDGKSSTDRYSICASRATFNGTWFARP